MSEKPAVRKRTDKSTEMSTAQKHNSISVTSVRGSSVEALVKPAPLKAKPKTVDTSQQVRSLAKKISVDAKLSPTVDVHDLRDKKLPKEVAAQSQQSACNINGAISIESHVGRTTVDKLSAANDILEEQNSAVTDISETSLTDCNTSTANDNRVMKVKSCGSHYYQVYDITAKGLSGRPVSGDHSGDCQQQSDGIEDKCSSPTGTVSKSAELVQTEGSTTCLRLVNDVEERHIAMPYTVVDVTVSTLTRQSNKRGDDIIPPQLPSTPAPIASSTLPRTPAPRAGKTAKHCDEHEPENKTRHSTAGSVMTSCENQTEDKWPVYMPKGLYEDIDSITGISEFSRQSSGRSSGGKSVEFEAKIAALSSIDFNKTSGTTQRTTVAPVPAKRDSKRDAVIAACSDNMSTNVSNDKTVQPSSSSSSSSLVQGCKQEKTRKGGKTFFHKLLNIKTKSSSVGDAEAQEDDTSSSSTTTSVARVEATDVEVNMVHRTPPKTEDCPSATVAPHGVGSGRGSQGAVMCEVKDILLRRQQIKSSAGVDKPLLIEHNVQIASCTDKVLTTVEGSTDSGAPALTFQTKASTASSSKPCPQSPRPRPLLTKPSQSTCDSRPLSSKEITGSDLASESCELGSDGRSIRTLAHSGVDNLSMDSKSNDMAMTNVRLPGAVVLIDLKDAQSSSSSRQTINFSPNPAPSYPGSLVSAGLTNNHSSLSLESSSQPENKPVKAPRKMMSAPPPPPSGHQSVSLPLSSTSTSTSPLVHQPIVSAPSSSTPPLPSAQTSAQPPPACPPSAAYPPPSSSPSSATTPHMSLLPCSVPSTSPVSITSLAQTNSRLPCSPPTLHRLHAPATPPPPHPQVPPPPPPTSPFRAGLSVAMTDDKGQGQGTARTASVTDDKTKSAVSSISPTHVVGQPTSSLRLLDLHTIHSQPQQQPATLSSSSSHSISSSNMLSAIIGNTNCPAGRMSQTLPRNIANSIISNEMIALNGDGIHLRHLNSSVKHVRQKTVSEGVSLDVWSNNEEQIGDVLLERRTSKFLNRALPEPPTEEDQRGRGEGGVREGGREGEESMDNLYELVSPSNAEQLEPHKQSSNRGVGGTMGGGGGAAYEDIDISTSPLDDASTSSSSHRSGSGGSSRQSGEESTAVVGGQLYLEPVATAVNSCGYVPAAVDDGRPRPALRGITPRCISARDQLMSSTEVLCSSVIPQSTDISDVNRDKLDVRRVQSASSSYINMKAEKQLLVSLEDSFSLITAMNVDVLRHLAQRHYAHYSQQLITGCCAEENEAIRWREFRLVSKEPLYSTDDVTFYRALNNDLTPTEFIIMIEEERASKSVVGGGSMCLGQDDIDNVNVLSPHLIFSLSSQHWNQALLQSCSSSILPTMQMTQSTGASCSSAATCSSRELMFTAGVLLSQSILSVDDYWQQQSKQLLQQQLSVISHERSVCYSIVQILDAMLYCHQLGLAVTRLRHQDILYILPSSSSSSCLPISTTADEWHPVVMRSVIGEICLDRDAATVCDGLAQLMLRILRLAQFVKTESHITMRTSYSRTMLWAVRALQEKTWECLVTVRAMLEFTLWGPPEDEAKIAAMISDKREERFGLWLEVSRCRLISKLLLDANNCHLEIAHQSRYLCSATDISLLNATKHLFI